MSMIGILPKKIAALLIGCFWATLFLTSGEAQAQCPVQASFIASSVYPCAGQTISFTNTSTGGPVGFTWFQDITFFSTATNPTRTFNTPGNYAISLLASNGTCVDTLSKVIVVNPTVNSTVTGTDASCNNFSDGSADLSPMNGTPNLSLDNVRATNDYVEANTVAATSYSSGITVEAWIKPRSNWTNSDGHFIAFNLGSGGNRFFVGYNASLQKVVYFDGNLGNQFQNGPISPRGTWMHVAVTINASNVVRMYIDGVLRKQVTTNSAWQPGAGDLFSIGQEWDLPNTSQHFDGNIDEVRIWNTSLTGATVLDNYNNSCASIGASHPNINNLIAYYSMNEGSGTFIFDRSGNDNHGTRTGAAWGLPADNTYGCFSAGTGYAYNWSNSATVEDPTGLAAATYTVTVTDGAGCTTLDTVIIGEPAPVVVNIASSPSDSICLGDTTQLTASGAATYTWSSTGGLSAITGATIGAFPTVNTTSYQVIGIDNMGCADTTALSIAVNALPTATIVGTDTICAGDSSALTAAGGTTYAWSNMANSAMTTVLPTATTTYTVTVTDTNGCIDTDQITINVNALPSLSIAGTDSICAGDSTTLTASGGNAYSWSNGALVASTTVNPSINTWYSVTVSDTNACFSTDSIEVVVNALPTLTITGDDTICDGQPATLTASGGTNYTWSNGGMTPTISVTPAVQTTYTVVVSTGFGCTATDSLTVNVIPSPTTAISGIDTVCSGDSTLLTANGGGTYLWSNGATSASTFVAPVNTGNFSVTVTNGSGCTASDTIIIFVSTQLIAKITPDSTQSICEGMSLNLSGTGGNSYLWSTGDTTSNVVVSPVATTSYTLTVSDGLSCDGTDTLLVIVNPNPTPVIIQVPNALTTTQLYTTTNWFMAGNSNSISSADTLLLSQNGSYYVTVTDSNGCSGTSDTLVNVVSRRDQLNSPISVTLFPNPNHGQFSIQMETNRAQEVEISIYDLLGQQVYARELKVFPGKFTEQINLQGLAKGVYMVQLHAAGTKSYHKIIVE
ncbi:MAG TPA: T9SS type A sorting domain-containing protein [Bacteroidetes bacterium]|nr:T9SS type A sorting domain-containing protein [Bacteroidota bacterium]